MHSITRKSHTAIVLAMTLAMTACGGGGGSGILPDPGSPEPASPEPASPEPTSPEFADIFDVYEADSGATSEAVQRAATALTQAGSVDVSGVSTSAAHAQVTFDDDGAIALTVTRDDGSSFNVNSDDHAYEFESLPRSETVLEHGADVGMIDITDDAATAAFIAADWEPGYGEWGALGFWVHLEGDIEDGSIRGVEVGAFVDGAELDGIPSLPPAGTATYSGEADGFYAGEYGTDADVPQGSQVIGTYTGDLTLVADFGAGTIGGHIGIGGEEFSEYVVTPSGDEVRSSGTADFRAELGAIPIDSDGSFSGQTVSVTHPEDPEVHVTSSEGAWGGKFSTIADGNGDPRLVAGTHGGNFTTEGGSEISFIGVFIGLTEAFAQP